MRTLRLLFLPFVTGLVFVAVFLPVDGTDATVSSPCSWRVVTSPNPSRHNYNSLTGVAAISASNIWAVGTSFNAGFPNHAIIEHWNGSNWSLVSSLSSGSSLNGVVAIAANNIWAVGTQLSQTLIEHWNGTNWSAVPSPNSGMSPQLTGVAAVSANDIWAVGYFFNESGARQALIEHR
jgi:hypothetical protein